MIDHVDGTVVSCRPALDHVTYYAIARDVALGMNYLHQHRPSVLHLDLKSMNVLLSQHLRAKIADFGFSKLRYALLRLFIAILAMPL